MNSENTDESRTRADAADLERQAWQRAQLAQVEPFDPEPDENILKCQTAADFDDLALHIKQHIPRIGADEAKVRGLLDDLAQLRRKVEALQT